MIKDIVVNLTIGVERDAAANYAISLASIFKAHLVGVAFVYDPKVSANLIVGIPAELIEAQRAATKHLANEAVARFKELGKQAGVMTESQMIDVAPGHVGDTFGRLARSFDLSVIRQAEPNKAEQEVPIIEGALFESGRPVIVVPYVQMQGAKFNRVMVGWDGSQTAARAIGDAMPVLERAKMIEIFTVVAGPTKNTELPGIDIGQHLSRHGLRSRSSASRPRASMFRRQSFPMPRISPLTSWSWAATATPAYANMYWAVPHVAYWRV